jgi:hypothetical protein
MRWARLPRRTGLRCADAGLRAADEECVDCERADVERAFDPLVEAFVVD